MKELIKYLKTVNLEFFQGWSQLLSYEQKKALERAGVQTPFVRIEGKDKRGKARYRVPKSYTIARTIKLSGGRTVTHTVDVVVR